MSILAMVWEETKCIRNRNMWLMCVAGFLF